MEVVVVVIVREVGGEGAGGTDCVGGVDVVGGALVVSGLSYLSVPRFWGRVR